MFTDQATHIALKQGGAEWWNQLIFVDLTVPLDDVHQTTLVLCNASLFFNWFWMITPNCSVACGACGACNGRWVGCYWRLQYIHNDMNRNSFDSKSRSFSAQKDAHLKRFLGLLFDTIHALGQYALLVGGSFIVVAARLKFDMTSVGTLHLMKMNNFLLFSEHA